MIHRRSIRMFERFLNRRHGTALQKLVTGVSASQRVKTQTFRLSAIEQRGRVAAVMAEDR